MTEQDARVSARNGGRPFEVSSPDGQEFHVRFVVSDADAYDRFYNVTANPMLWFIQHYLWDLSNAPDIRRQEVDAFEFGYNIVNEDIAHAVLEEIEDQDGPGRDGPRLPPLHAAGRRATRAPGCVPAPLRPHPVVAAGLVARAAAGDARRDLRRASSANDIVGFHTRSYRHNFLQCCRDLIDLDVNFTDGIVQRRRPRDLGARLPAARSTTARRARSRAARRSASTRPSCCAAAATT